MIARALLAVLFVISVAPAGADEVARIAYIGVEPDPRYEPQPVYTGLSLKDRHRPVDGVRLAFRDTRVLGRALGIGFELDEILLAPDDDPVSAVRAAKENALAVLLDLPSEDTAAVVAAEGQDGLLINIRHGAERWRGADCAPALVHTPPSEAMLAEALAQYLRSQGWDDVLLLVGSTPDDLPLAAAARSAAKKVGLTIVAERSFELTNDPRRRDLSNIRLLTGGVRHDVVWLVDAEGEFGRYVPFATYAARPIVGSEGLVPVAWHWTLERYGAPQLNQRFRRLADRDMTSDDWAGWVAVRAVVEAVSQTRSIDPSTVQAMVRSPALTIDLYKGVRGSFRDWNGQLRQPLLLATSNAVIAVAPIEGFEHQLDVLDTLGADRGETACVLCPECARR